MTKSKTMNFQLLTRGLDSELRAKFELSRAYYHAMGRGDERELALRDVLASFLPEHFGIEKGEVFDADGNISREFDLIIFDKREAFFSGISVGRRKFIPAESVYAIIEVKSKLNSTEFRKTVTAFESLDRLHRHYKFIDQVLGLSEEAQDRLKKGLGFFESFQWIGKPFSIIVAFDAIKNERFASLLTLAPDHLIIVCIPGREVVVRAKNNLPAHHDKGFRSYWYERDSFGVTAWVLLVSLMESNRSRYYSTDIRRYQSMVVWFVKTVFGGVLDGDERYGFGTFFIPIHFLRRSVVQ